MIIGALARQLNTSEAYAYIVQRLEAQQDAILACTQSIRPLIVATLWQKQKRSHMFVVPGQETAQRAVRTLGAWIGFENVLLYPSRPEITDQDKQQNPACIGMRARATEALHNNEHVVVVSDARSLLQKVPPSSYYQSSTFTLGEEHGYEKAKQLLVQKGYEHEKELARPGTFFAHGDLIDIFPAHETHPYRVEFFGDEIDRIRSLLNGRGQAIKDIKTLTVYPATEYEITSETQARAEKALWEQAQTDAEVAQDLENLLSGIHSPRHQRYLAALYGKTTSMLAHIHKDALVYLSEPKALIDDCVRYYDELKVRAQKQKLNKQYLSDTYFLPNELNFGNNQRLTFSVLMQGGIHLDAELSSSAPNVAGADDKLFARLQELTQQKYAIVCANPDRTSATQIQSEMYERHLPYTTWQTLKQSQELQLPVGITTFVDSDPGAGVVVPSAHLAIITRDDLISYGKHHKAHKIPDVTKTTFAFKPGDYVVHAVHGVAKFSEIVRQAVDGYERDYFKLEYAEGDKLYVPVERVDRITRYVGSGNGAPKLTRLNTKEWSRAVGAAKKSAKKLAFDLVNVYARRAASKGYAFPPDTALQQEMEASFPYELTPDQKRALSDIKADMESTRPMDRLLSGDVGFGKTELALRAAFKAVQDKKQVLVMAPTTILAQQHFDTFSERLKPFGVRIEVLSRIKTTKQQRDILRRLAHGELDILIGTHRLLSADVIPHNVGLVIVDEEQRFGVGAKEQIKDLREQVDVLTLSATPIPRTLQMSLSGVRDMSLIMTAPHGRVPVNVEIAAYSEDIISDAIRKELARGGQVYYVSNRVKTIDEACERVKVATPEARIGVAHGQMSPQQTEEVMLAFEMGEIDVLIATTIIESGLDNPHTNTLIVEDSEHLGLAQLYQLKGRIGRGNQQAYAYFLYPPHVPLTEDAVERLQAIYEFQELGSGMRVAMKDLELRGAGSIVGAEQHGNVSKVGFDLFMQLLSEAVNKARGEMPDDPAAQDAEELMINVAGDYYFSPEYIEPLDERVMAYRRLAAARTKEQIDLIEQDLKDTYGPLERAEQNLISRAKVRLLAHHLGITSITTAQHKLIIQGIDLKKEAKQRVEEAGVLVFPLTHKLTLPLDDEIPAIEDALGLLELIASFQP